MWRTVAGCAVIAAAGWWVGGCGEPAPAALGGPAGAAATTADGKAGMNGEAQPAPAAAGPLWQPVALPATAADKTLRSIFFLNDKQGWMVGDGGLCLSTTDGGGSWQTVATGSDAVLRQVRFNDAEHGYICGDGDSEAPAASGHVVMGLRPMKASSLLTTEDGGKTWKKNWVPTNFEVWCVETSAAPVLQVGVGCPGHLDGDITRSNDNGAHWKDRRVYRSLADIRAVDDKRWIAVGSPVSVGFMGPPITDPNYLAKRCRALFSDDGGKTWSPAKGSDGGSVLRALLVRKDQPVIAVGDDGTVLTSTDRGENWTETEIKGAENLRGIAAVGETLVAVGKHGRFARSIDGGKTWQVSWVGKDLYVNAIATCGGRFFCVGQQGQAWMSAAGTLTAAQELPTPPTIEEKPSGPAKPPPPKTPATAAQRARVRVGDAVTYEMKADAPAMGVNHVEYTQKTAITAVDKETYTLSREVVKGSPPPGRPKKSTAINNIADLEDYAGLEVGKDKKETSSGIEFTTKRLADETVTVGEREIACQVLESDGTSPQGMQIHIKQWLNTELVPESGLVKFEMEQTLTVQGGQTIKIVESEKLAGFERGKE